MLNQYERLYMNSLISGNLFYADVSGSQSDIVLSGKSDVLFIGRDDTWYPVLSEALRSVARVSRIAPERLRNRIKGKFFKIILLDTLDLQRGEIETSLRTLKRIYKDAQIIVVSSSVSWKEARNAFRAGATDHITKRFNATKLRDDLLPYLSPTSEA